MFSPHHVTETSSCFYRNDQDIICDIEKLLWRTRTNTGTHTHTHTYIGVLKITTTIKKMGCPGRGPVWPSSHQHKTNHRNADLFSTFLSLPAVGFMGHDGGFIFIQGGRGVSSKFSTLHHQFSLEVNREDILFIHSRVRVHNLGIWRSWKKDTSGGGRS